MYGNNKDLNFSILVVLECDHEAKGDNGDGRTLDSQASEVGSYFEGEPGPIR